MSFESPCTRRELIGYLPVLSIPTFGVSVARAGSSPGSKALLPSLKDVDALLQRALALSLSRAAPSQLRELSLLIANLRGLQSSFGKANQHAVGVAATLGESSFPLAHDFPC